MRPDGLGRIEGPQGSVAFALELDRGTESRDQLAEKLERYSLVAPGPDAPEAVLFCFTTAEREQSAREVLGHPGVSVATTSLERHRADPLGAVWRPVGVDRRVRIGELSPESTSE